MSETNRTPSLVRALREGTFSSAWRVIAGAVCAAAILLQPAHVAAEPSIRVKRGNGGMVEIAVQERLTASAAVVWETLTDYDRLSRFIPSLRDSRVISGPGEPLRVTQRGEARILWFRFRIEITFEIEIDPQREIRFRGIAGNLRDMVGSYVLEPEGDTVLLRYEARFRPSFPVPPLVGPAIVRREVRYEFRALVAEIARRSAAAGPVAAPVPSPAP